MHTEDKVQHQSQQKCIVIFALLCCFAVLVALIFSAVDVWGEDEDGITEENCNKNCRPIGAIFIWTSLFIEHCGIFYYLKYSGGHLNS
ncbi:hypothetical protein DPEC_G00034460 [Dallia pectoralis]|uniref:Uncharacterized protein n=1 Tax=Dallia pectoralis TaxID=75939 RepID=A0ACC2HDS2_DALPE|nr:hypothetical protein DPEC_G00034460 [Dallia pectoralis]